MCQEFLNLAHLHFHLFFKLNQKTFPSVNSREVSVQIPVKFGYDFTLGEKLHFIPSVGAYGRFSMVSINENVTENTSETQEIASNGTASTTINIIPIALMVISDGMLEA